MWNECEINAKIISVETWVILEHVDFFLEHFYLQHTVTSNLFLTLTPSDDAMTS